MDRWPEGVVQAFAERLSSAIVPMGTPHALGTRAAHFALFGADDAGFRSKLGEVLADRDDRILASYVKDETGVPYRRLREELASQTKRTLAQLPWHPPPHFRRRVLRQKPTSASGLLQHTIRA